MSNPLSVESAPADWIIDSFSMERATGTLRRGAGDAGERASFAIEAWSSEGTGRARPARFWRASSRRALRRRRSPRRLAEAANESLAEYVERCNAAAAARVSWHAISSDEETFVLLDQEAFEALVEGGYLAVD